MPSKALLLSVFIIISNIVSGINYYISSDGNDSSDGLSESTAWRTLSKLNSVGSTFSAGDRILLRRGDVFYGSLIISSSGAEANPIVFGAYGSGENPVITGFKTLSSWTYVKPGIYRSPLSTSSPVNMVSLNGSPQTLGRYPNTGYLIFESHYSNRSITDNELNASPDWSGAELVLKKNPYSLFRNKITNHSGNTIYYTANFSGEPTNGYGYFIQNNLNTLDSFGEWYHDGTYLYVFFGDKSPDSYTVQASTINRLITVYGQNNLIIENISFIGANSEAIAASNFNNLIVRHCSINYSGKFAITYIDNIYNSQYFTIDNCHINNTNDCAIYLNGNIKNCIITNNTILNSGLKPGMGSGFYGGIYCIGSNGHFEYNHIENVGRNALWFQGEGSLVKNNFINNFCMIMDDAGAIYLCDYASTLNKKIIGNIVLNGYGNREGIPNTWPETEGIYLDTRSKNVEVIGNTVANCGDAGIKLHDASDIVIKGNTCYNNYRQSMFHQQSYDYPIKNLTIQENIFFSKQPDQVSLFFKSVQENIKSFATLDNNCYTRPLAEDNLIYTYTSKTGSKFRTLEEWKAYTLQDVNSYKTQVPVTDASDIRFYYNAGKTNKVITLDVPMLDVKGTRYKSSITLLPYTSVILIVDPTNDGTDKLGQTAVFSSVSVQNNRRATPLTFSESAMIESITVYHEGGTGNLLYGVYSDESGNPSSLLGVTSVTPVNETSGWQTVSLTDDVMVNSGQTVWLSWVFEKNPGVRYTSGTPGRAQSTSTWSDGMPATFGPATYSDYIYSVYCTYNYDFEVIDSLSLGNKKVYKSVSVQNNRRAMPLTFSEPVMIESITVYHEGGTGNLLYGVYSDESGNPSSLLGVTSVTPVNETSGWQTVSLTDDVMVNSGQTVWLSWVFEKNPGVRYTSGTPGRAQSTSTWSDGMPATFGPATYSDYIYSVYCTYNYDFEVIDSLSLGNKKVYKSVSVQNNRRAMPLTFSEPVMIESITVYHEGGTGNLLYGVYSDESGNPSSLLGVTSVTPVNETSGWQTVSLTDDVMVNSGQTVWLSWVFETNPGVRYTSGTPGRAQSTSTWSDGMPATFGPATYSDYIYSVYCTYNYNFEVIDSLSLGNKKVYKSVSVQNNRRAMPLTFSEPVMIESITVYHEGGTGNLLYGVYSDESGNPSSLLGVTSVTPVNETSGWQTVSLTDDVMVNSGQTVWLSWVFEKNPGVRYTSGTPGRAQSTSTWSDGMPATFGPATYSDYIYSVYCTYNYDFEVIDSLSLGNKKVYKSVSVQNNRRAMPLTFSEPAMIESITVYHEGGTGNLLYGVYSDESGNPSSLLGVTSVTPVNETSGWQTVSLTDDVMVNSGQTVWLSWVFETNPGVRYTSGTPGRAQSTSTWSDGMPATFGPATYSDYIYSVYCTYNYNFEVIDSLSLGNKKVYKSVSVQNNRRAMPLTFSEPVMIESITVYHEGGTGNLLYGVYSDESGNPSSLLGVTSVTPVNETSGWQTVSLTDDVMVNSGQTVWLSWVFEKNPGVRYTSGTPGRAQSTSTWSDGMPATFGPATYSDYIYSVYCTYNYDFEVIDSLSLGNKKVYKSVSVQNNRRAMPLTFSEPVMIESITVYHEGGTGNLLYGVYSDESGNPSSLLGVTSVTPVNETSGWQTVSLTDDVMVNSGQTVWLSWVFEKNPGVRYTSGTPGRAQSTSTWSDGMPATFGPATYSDYIYSVYCTYNYDFEVIDSLSLGNKKVYKSVSVQNNRRAMPLTFSEPVMIESITVYHEGGTGNLLYGVYSDESGNPSSLLGVTSVTPVNETSGWQTVSLTDDVMVNSGQTVWLSWVFEKNPGVRYTSGTPGRAQSTSTWSDGMPATFGPATYSDYIYSVYCTYNYDFEVIDSLSLGNKKVYKSVSVQNNRRAMPLTFSEPAMIESITVYHEGGTGNLLYGVYSDESGNPSSLLGVTSVTPVNETSGWQTVSLTDDVMVNSGQTVWLSWVFEKNPGVRYTSGTPGRAQSTSTWSDGMPATFGPATYSDYIYSVYCTYNYDFEVIDSLSLGNKKVYKSVSVQNNRRAMPLTFSEPAMIESITVYHEGGTGNLLYGVYSDESGNPSSLLGVTSVTPVNETSGWQTVSLTDDVMVNSGQTVWLSWVFEKNPGVRYTSGTPGRAQSTSTWSDGMPTTFGPATYSDYIYSVYCTYNNNIEVFDNLTLGNKEIYKSVSVQNNRRAMPLTFSEPAMIESITVYHEGGTGNLLFGVYSDESGNPSSLLGVTSVTPVNETAGWQTVNLSGSGVTVTEGQTVWLSWVFETNPGVRYTSGTPGRAQSSSTWSDGMPTTFGPATYSDYIYSVYCTYWSAINNGAKSIESEGTKGSYYFDDDKPVVEPIQEAFEKVVVYPNPTRGNLTVSWNNYSKDRILMVIYNFNGLPFKKEYIGPGINEIHLDLSDVNPGMYIIELRDETTGLLINRSKIIKR